MGFVEYGIIVVFVLLTLILFLLIAILIKSGKNENLEKLAKLEEQLLFYSGMLNEIKNSLSALNLEFENKLLKNVSGDLSNTREQIVDVLGKLKEEIVRTKKELESSSSTSLFETKNRLTELEKRVNATIAEVNQSLTETTKDLMENITQTINDINRTFGEQTNNLSGKIGAMTEKIENLEKISSEIKQLQDILKPPKQRGIFGEILLENLLKDTLPTNRFSLQFPIGKDRVDAVIFLESTVLPIDAKFPLDKFKNYIESKDKRFENSIKKMIDDISSKYIKVLTSEGNTTNFAFMYVPSESVWYSMFVEHIELYSYAVSKRVFPVSPNTFFSYLHIISEGLKAFEIEGKAEEIIHNIISLKNEIEASLTSFNTLKTHLLNAANKTDESIGFLKRISLYLEKFKKL